MVSAEEKIDHNAINQQIDFNKPNEQEKNNPTSYIVKIDNLEWLYNNLDNNIDKDK